MIIISIYNLDYELSLWEITYKPSRRPYVANTDVLPKGRIITNWPHNPEERKALEDQLIKETLALRKLQNKSTQSSFVAEFRFMEHPIKYPIPSDDTSYIFDFLNELSTKTKTKCEVII